MLNENLKNIFSQMNEAGVNYVVLRNYLPMQNLNLEGDIDILVHPDDTKRIKKILLVDGWLKRMIPREDGHMEMFKFSQEKKAHILDIQNDLLFGPEKMKIGDTNKVLSKKKLLEGCLYAPHEIHGLILLIFRLSLEKSVISDEHFTQLEALYDLSRNNKDFFEIIKKDFGQAIRESLAEILENKKNLLDNQNYKNLAQVARKNFTSRKIGVIAQIWPKIKIKFYQCIALVRPIRLITFVGSDGSGKSTLVERLKYFSPVFRTQIYLGWRGYYFKSLEKLEKKSLSANKTVKSISDRLRFILFNSLLPIDLFIRFLKIKKNAEYGIIISDRYPLPKKYSGRSRLMPIQKIWAKFTLGLTYFLLPKPSLLFILTGDAKKLWERKKEGSFNKLLDEIERSLEAKKVFKCQSVTIKTDCSIEESFNKVYQSLFSYFSK